MLKPILGPCDSYQLAPFSYEWAWNMYKDCRRNEWAPQEIGVGADVQDWRSAELPEVERHLFLSVMAQLTTFDIERGDDAAETFLRIIQPAELKQFLKRLIFEEAGHTESYRYCIENMGIPEYGPDNIYDIWKRVPAFKERIEFAQALSAPLLAWNHAKIAAADYSIADKQAFFRAAFYWFLIFEGTMFWMSLLGPIQALARLGHFRQTAEQFTYIARDECLAEGTEVLTPNGWLSVEEVTPDTELAQWHTDNTLSWATPMRLSAHRAEEYYEFSLESRGFKQRVSANHRFLYYTKDWNLKVVPAHQATPNPYSTHPVAAPLREFDGPTLSCQEQFQIAFQADGSKSDRYDGSRVGTIPIRFSFAKQRKIERLLSIVETLGWKYSVTARPQEKKADQVLITVAVPLTVPLDKNLANVFSLKDKSLNWCQEFITEIGNWDGHIVPENPSRVRYSSINEPSVDFVQAVAALAGYRTKYTLVEDSRSSSFSNIHRLFISRHENSVRGGKMVKEKVVEAANMYGIEVPSSFLLIRDGKCVSITGNSQHIKFGVNLLREFMQQYPEAICLDQIQEDTITSLLLEDKYIQYCLSKGQIPGYTVAAHSETARAIANMRFRSVGLPELFEGAVHQFPWFSEVLELKKEKNFFETRVTEYQTGGVLSFDETGDADWDPFEGMLPMDSRN